MRQGEVLGVERRRRWSDDEKLEILERVGHGGRSVADVARDADVTRQHIYQWRRELRSKGLWPNATGGAIAFMAVDTEEVSAPGIVDEAAAGFEVVLRNGRTLRCRGGFELGQLVRLIQLVEAA